jgi:hypothetical protein
MVGEVAAVLRRSRQVMEGAEVVVWINRSP